MKRRKFADHEGRDRARFPMVESHHRNMRRHSLVGLLVSVLAVLGTAHALSATPHKPEPADRKKATEAEHRKPNSADLKKSSDQKKSSDPKKSADQKKSPDQKKGAEAEHHKPKSSDRKKSSDQKKSAERKKAIEAEHHKLESPDTKKAVEVHHKHIIEQPAPGDAAAEPLPPDLVATKQANELMRAGKAKDATALAASMGDPVAAKLVEWALLRHFDGAAGFDRYDAFIRANPDWPSMTLLRRHAEARLWQERRDAATVRRFVGKEPISAAGRLALARVEMGEGDRADAEGDGSRGVAVGAIVGRIGSRGARRVPRRADPRRPCGADGPAHRRQGFWRRDCAPQNASATIKSRSSRRASPRRRNPPKAARCSTAVPADAREDLGYALCRVHWLHAQRYARLKYSRPHRDTQGRRCGRGEADARRVAGRSAASRHRRMVARAPRVGPQAYRPRRCGNRLPGGVRRCASSQSLLPRRGLISWPAGSRCVSSPIRPRRCCISPTSMTA